MCYNVDQMWHNMSGVQLQVSDTVGGYWTFLGDNHGNEGGAHVQLSFCNSWPSSFCD